MQGDNLAFHEACHGRPCTGDRCAEVLRCIAHLRKVIIVVVIAAVRCAVYSSSSDQAKQIFVCITRVFTASAHHSTVHVTAINCDLRWYLPKVSVADPTFEANARRSELLLSRQHGWPCASQSPLKNICVAIRRSFAAMRALKQLTALISSCLQKAVHVCRVTLSRFTSCFNHAFCLVAFGTCSRQGFLKPQSFCNPFQPLSNIGAWLARLLYNTGCPC